MRALVVEDDRKIASFIVTGLEQERFVVDQASDGEAGLDLALSTIYDAAVIDIMLPKLDGLSLVEKMRAAGVTTPVLILSAKSSVDDRIHGLQRGGDDYLTKPFSFAELVARIHALIRRSTRREEPTSLCAGGLSMDLLRRTVTRDGREIELQPREFALLEYLLRNEGRVVSRTMIMEQVWGYDFDPQTNVVESRISRLREKIDRGFQAPFIRTVRGAGYILEHDGNTN